MTIQQILSLPTDDLAKLSDAQLETLLGPLIPLARTPDKESAKAKQLKDTLAKGEQMLKLMKLIE